MRKRSKQIAAIIGIILLLSLYLLTLFSAFLDFPYSDRLFQASLVATVAVPILLWIYIWLFQQVAARKKEAAEQQNQGK